MSTSAGSHIEEAHRRTRRVMLSAILVMMVSVLAAVVRLTDRHAFTGAVRGDRVAETIGCLRVVAVHGDCGLCRALALRELDGDVVWLTIERHPQDGVFPDLRVDRELWDELRVESLPVAFVVRDRRVRWIGNPAIKPIPACTEV